jgi:ACS family tartrate transporter-like MFS transporter
MCLAAVGIFGTLGPFWTLPTRYLRGRAAAAGIAVINSTGAISGFVAPTLIGWARQRTGMFTAGLLVVAASLAVGAVLVLSVPSSADV